MNRDWLAVFEALKSVYADKAYSNMAINEALLHHNGCKESFVRNYAKGVLRDTIKLDYFIDSLASRGIGKIKVRPLIILRMGIYAINSLGSVPEHAAVNESVNLARRVARGSEGFINGVLRSYVRNRDELVIPGDRDDVRYSVNSAIISLLREQYGDEAEDILNAFNEPSKTIIRVNRLRAGRADVIDSLSAMGVEAEASSESPNAIVSSGSGIVSSDLYKAGLISIQSLSSMIAIEALDPKPGSKVLDMCAAPGGKTVLAADLTGRDGHVFSRDISEKRAARIRENVTRCRLENVTVEVKDAREEDGLQADVVIADVPCSGFGDIGRKPEIRYRVDEKRIRELTVLQREILSSAVRHLKPGGTLLFSTCTFGHAENRDNFFWLRDTFGLQPVPLTDRIPEELLKNEDIRRGAAEGYVQLLPGDAECDGFFFSCLKQI